MADFDRESMLEMFSFEMSQLLEQLEQNIIQGESGYTIEKINEIFRIMHTIKGSAAMMMFNNISTTAHAIEDLFYYLREENPGNVDASKVTDLVLETLDFIKEEIAKIEEGQPADGECTESIERIKEYLQEIKALNGHDAPKKTETKSAATIPAQSAVTKQQNDASSLNHFHALIKFDDGCEMENVRAFTVANHLKDYASNISYKPENVLDESTIQHIRDNGFSIDFYTPKRYDEIYRILKGTIYLKDLTLEEVSEEDIENNYFTVNLRFDDGCEMENVRAYTVVHNLQDKVKSVKHMPEDLIDEASIDVIRKNGLNLSIVTDKSYDQINQILFDTLFLKELSVEQESTEAELVQEKQMDKVLDESQEMPAESTSSSSQTTKTQQQSSGAKKTMNTQHVISVNVNKLDDLLKLVGQLVISEAMVTQNPELEGMEIDGFHKEATQLRNIIKDLQDTVLSMRMVPLATTFFKMHRIVRDMCKQLGKEIQLDIIGEETEVDKTIPEHISDPLMHIIRNSADHGIELPAERVAKGKPEKGVITLEATNVGGDVVICVKDDGAGLNKEKILQKAKSNGLLNKPESEYTDKEIFQFIFMPGFSTNDQVTSYSGRGVGMDVVVSNLEAINGTLIVDSVPDEGSTFTLKIPSSLSIIEGMMVKMDGAKYTLPIASIKTSFKPENKDVFIDPSGNEMIAVMGEVYNVVRLYEFFKIDSAIKNLEDGIMIMVENGEDTICLFVDELLGEHQVVIKPIPKYIKRIKGIAGCTLLGNGDISLILDVAGLFN